MSPYPGEPDAPDGYRSVADLLERPPVPINWNLLAAEQAEIEWHDLDQWVKWLKSTSGLPPNIVPPYWHATTSSSGNSRHCTATGSAATTSRHRRRHPSTGCGSFADARSRLRDWVSICGTRLDRDRPTRQTTWPGELPADAGGEIEIRDGNKDFADFVREDVLRRRRIEAIPNQQLLG